jgi:hypothetical protein
MAFPTSSPCTFTLDDVALYRVVTTTDKPLKTLLYQGTVSIFYQDGKDDDDEDEDDVLCIQCGNALTLPVAGQHFERFENGLFMCPADNGDDEEAALKKPGFITFGFKLSVDAEQDAEGLSTNAANAFQELLVKNALFSDRRKCYAAKKVEQGGKEMSSTIGKGAALFGRGMSSGSKFLKRNMKKGNQEVDLTKTGSAIKTVKKLSGRAANATQVVSSVIVKKSIQAGEFVGDRVNHISYVQRLKERRRASAKAKKGKPLSRLDKLTKGATEVALALGHSGLGVFGALNDAADVILDDTIQAAGDVVEHKYGEQAGQLAEDTLGIGVDGFKVYRTGTQGAKRIAKGIATDAAVQGTGALVMETLEEDNVDNSVLLNASIGEAAKH